MGKGERGKGKGERCMLHPLCTLLFALYSAGCGVCGGNAIAICISLCSALSSLALGEGCGTYTRICTTVWI